MALSDIEQDTMVVKQLHSCEAMMLPRWEKVQLGNVIRFARKPKELRYTDYNRIPFVPMEYIPIGQVLFTQFDFKNVDKISSGTYFEPGDILLAKITPSFENGKQGIIPNLPVCFGIATTEVIPINEIDGVSDKYFLFYYLLKNDIRAELANKMEGSTGRQRLSVSALANLEISLPPLPEQRAIAHILQTVQNAIQARRKELELERERKAALMQHLFTHGTLGEPTKQTEIGEMPESWHIEPLGMLATIERGKFAHRPRNAPEFYGGHIPFIQTGDVTACNGHIRTYTQTLNERGLSISKIFPQGTIVITIAANIGYTGILEFDSAFPDSLIGISSRDPKTIDNAYLNHYLATQQPDMDRKAPQGTQKNINIEFLSPWPIIFPPLNEQQEIVAILDSMDSKITALEKEIALQEELFRALLDELMTGRLSTLPLVK